MERKRDPTAPMEEFLTISNARKNVPIKEEGAPSKTSAFQRGGRLDERKGSSRKTGEIEDAGCKPGKDCGGLTKGRSDDREKGKKNEE